ncbi:hypothetical protein BDR26DRAFT_929604 [Obelidium mucronatum]|nr:hypothetical protein BDR26DRAFT_929604 [Obelidium mucronatum]
MSSIPLLGQRGQTIKSSKNRVFMFGIGAVCILVWTLSLPQQPPANRGLLSCEQVGPLVPTGNVSWIDRFTLDKDYMLAASERLAGAVRIPTESYDYSRGVPPPLEGPDPVHEGFENLHKYLERVFPLVHKHLARKVINRYALLYTWKGSQESLSPLVLMAHQDTVPVLPDTLDQWTHPPFSGLVDFENDAIWGRGSVDTKPTLVGSLEAIEVLLGNGYQPKKTVFLAFGYDEEISGSQGARFVAEYLENELNLVGKIGLILDEGLDSLTNADGFDLAVISTAEKGYVDYHMTVETPGGHSSIPPLHTGIGLMSQLVNALEANPHPVLLTKSNPYFGSIVCTAQYTPNPDPFIQNALDHFDAKSQALADYLAKRSLKDRYRMASSQAIDIINGGLKVNALPELVTVDLNNRISIDSNVQEFQQIVLNNLLPVAKKFALNFTFMDFLQKDVVLGSFFTPDAVGTATVFSKPTDSALEPSPISPIGSPEWKMVEGTIHHVYERVGAYGVEKEGSKRYVVAPGLMAGNTDTRYFWNLSKNIFRFAPALGGTGYHTINEKASIKGYMSAVTFYHELIRNYDHV